MAEFDNLLLFVVQALILMVFEYIPLPTKSIYGFCSAWWWCILLNKNQALLTMFIQCKLVGLMISI